MTHPTLLTVGLLLALAVDGGCSQDYDDRWITRPPIEYEFPHVVYIAAKDSAEFCSGSLIHPSWVLTAASCMYKGSSLMTDFATALDVYAGVSNRSQLQIYPAQKRKSVQVQFPDTADDIRHYSPALIQVNKAFNLDKTIGTGLVVVSSCRFADTYHDLCTSGSFGTRNWQDSPPETRIKKLDLTSHECGCEEQMKTAFPPSLIDHWICGESKDAVGICRGDFGMGMMCDGDLVAVSVGLMRMEKGEDEESCEIKDPATTDCNPIKNVGLFVDICYYLKWMRLFVPGLQAPKKSCKALAHHPRASLWFVFTVVLSYPVLR